MKLPNKFIVAVLLMLGLVLLFSPVTLYSVIKASSEELPSETENVDEKTDVSQETFKTGKNAYVSIVEAKATQHGVSASLMISIIDCENKNWQPDLQSGLYYKKDRPKQGLVKGQREQSFGLVQIHLPDHPSISYEQATNPTFSINFLAQELRAGRGGQWSCHPSQDK